VDWQELKRLAWIVVPVMIASIFRLHPRTLIRWAKEEVKNSEKNVI
jgi:hypothetical protein